MVPFAPSINDSDGASLRSVFVSTIGTVEQCRIQWVTGASESLVLCMAIMHCSRRRRASLKPFREYNEDRLSKLSLRSLAGAASFKDLDIVRVSRVPRTSPDSFSN